VCRRSRLTPLWGEPNTGKTDRGDEILRVRGLSGSRRLMEKGRSKACRRSTVREVRRKGGCFTVGGRLRWGNPRKRVAMVYMLGSNPYSISQTGEWMTCL